MHAARNDSSPMCGTDLFKYGLQWANSRCEPLSLILVDDDDDDDDDFSKDCTSTQALDVHRHKVTQFDPMPCGSTIGSNALRVY